MLQIEENIFRSNGTVRRRTEAPLPENGKKYKPMGDIMRLAKPASVLNGGYYSEIRCEQCRSGEREDELVLCDRCDMGYHLYCLRPIAVRVPVGDWFCPSCTGGRNLRRFSQLQKKIVKFFRIQELGDGAGGDEFRVFRRENRKRRRRSMPLVRHKKRRRILPFAPSKDPKQRLEQMRSLATALTALQMEFCNDLTYMLGMAPKSSNKAIYEKGGMQLLAKKDKETLEICRTMYRRGECPPLVVIFDSCEGFTVEADEDIKDMTFITEYTGDVDYLEKREIDDCNSMMTLLIATNPSHSLVVCPDKRGNIACFISGINNHTLEGRKKQNLKCVRYNVDGESRVLLVTCRDISRGERLYYDYNGYEQEYPTEHFF